MKHSQTLPEGIYARYQHHREKDTGKIIRTVCRLATKEGEQYIPVAEGVATVGKREPSPSKERGRAIALGRALKNLELDSLDRQYSLEA